MEEKSLIGIILILANGLVTYHGLKNLSYFEKYAFKIKGILVRKEYQRLLTSGFLHGSWTHFGFNMITLYIFSGAIETSLGLFYFLGIYFASLIGGNLFALYIHRNHPAYTAVGASGAISGIVFASIALFPGMELGLIFLPIYIPSWAFGLLYVLFSIYGIKSQSDNVGHEAHLGGGLVGLICAIAIVPQSMVYNYLPIILILVPSAIFIYIIFARPEILLPGQSLRRNTRFYTFEDRYNSEKKYKEKELDLLLEKISKKGFDSLTDLEKKKLDQFSNKY